MSDALARKDLDVRDVASEANALQFKATVPENTVWVGASAGSGKTKVLAERVLRLLLPGVNRAGADPAKILCITFTKAAASEVLERIMKYLRSWTITDAANLQSELTKLLGAVPTAEQASAARALFARVLEVPGGMKIMTIHAFCQSVLARFPMEAGLTPGFEVVEEADAAALMTRVRHDLITQLQGQDTPLARAFDYLSSVKNADDIEGLMRSLASERGRLSALRVQHGDVDGVARAVDANLDVSPGMTLDVLRADALKYIPADDLRSILPDLNTGVRNKARHDELAAFLASPDVQKFDEYVSIFLTDKKTVRVLDGAAKTNEQVQRIFGNEAVRLQRYDITARNIACANATKALLRFAYATLDAYEVRKNAVNALDFEDLIDRTRKLLAQGGVQWVHYKLDGGIDHILVDEAQDTNPDQWDIVSALYDEFYDGTSAREPLLRTTFVVGDEKQSIFSFQRADPAVFETTRKRLKERVEAAQQPYDNVPMRISFRSAPSVLQVVDAVFASDEMQQGVIRGGDSTFTHEAFHRGKAGHVEIWPLIEKTDGQEKSDWDLPALTSHAESPVTQMARKVASAIAHLLKHEKLESQGRDVGPGDIMILLNKRKPMADAILKALRAENIPVGGIDRMVVTKQLAVMDVLSVLNFVLQPDDDLNLATLLKSPFIGMSEDALYALCQPRQGPLWQAFKANAGPVVQWLSGLLEQDGRQGVSGLLHRLLYAPCPVDAHSGMRALQSRLGADVRDPLQELLARADRFDMSDPRSLQGFVQDALRDISEIKRQMQEDGNRVRMMTVHGSKGLEAPIVFMPDTVRATASGTRVDAVLWPARDDVRGVPLWAPNKEVRADAYEARVMDARVRVDEEYKRLLYVAMTRAAERLYIGGAQKSDAKNTDKTKSWYFRILDAFTPDRLPTLIEREDGTKFISNRQSDAVKPKTHTQHTVRDTVALPAWAFQTAPLPDFPPKPLAPSKPEGEEPAALSPLFGDTSYRYKRGRVIHTLFQFLPDLPHDLREVRASEWLAQPAHGLSENAQAEILTAVFAVLDDPIFAKLFTADARAEVPLTGLLGPHTIVSGQIDRLLVRDDGVWIIDYKTNRPAPKVLAGVPDAYKRQMRTYRDLLRTIWPERPVHCALLWTDGPDLMDITDILDA